MSTSIYAGGLVVKDPDAVEVFTMDWGLEHLPVGVTITTSTWIITGPDSVLTKDNETVLAGSRKTQLRLLAGTFGHTYTVTNRIVTSETPSQTKDASFVVLIQHS